MTPTEHALPARALRGYELGRAAYGLRALWLLVPLLAVAIALGQSAAMTGSVGALLFALTCGLRFRGGVAGRAASAGLLAAAAPLVLPFTLRTIGHCCVGGACMSWCMAGCVAGGAVAGAGIGLCAIAERDRSQAIAGRDRRWTFLLTATLVSGLCGVLGCAVAGLSGTVGMALAIAASSLPICWVASPRYST